MTAHYTFAVASVMESSREAKTGRQFRQMPKKSGIWLTYTEIHRLFGLLTVALLAATLRAIASVDHPRSSLPNIIILETAADCPNRYITL